MTFSKQISPIVTGIGNLQVRLISPDAISPFNAFIEFDRINAVGQITSNSTQDLVPELTAAQIATVTSFLTALRTKAIAEAI